MTTPIKKDSLNTKLNELEIAIRGNMDGKRVSLMEKWLSSWTFYIKRESKFKPHENIKYHAGDIVTVCYGFNVGSEQGGNRPAVVVENNDHSNRTVMVVPLSSLESGEKIYSKDVYLGELVEFNTATNKPPGTTSVAVINQMRAISKQRIIRPTKETDVLLYLDAEGLQKIYNQIAKLYTTAVGRQKVEHISSESEVAGTVITDML